MNAFAGKPGVWRLKKFASLGVVLAYIAVACGGDSATKSSGQAATPEAVAARSAVAALMTRPTTLDVPALPAKPPTGKTLVFVACGVPVCVQFGAILKPAADAVGWKFKQLDGGVTPQSLNAAYEEAARSNIDGVIGSGGFPQELFQLQLDKLHAKGVPVVLLFLDKAGPNITAVVNDAQDMRIKGRQMGQWILADSGGHNAHVTLVNSIGAPIFEGSHDEIRKQISAPGCDSCSVDKIDVTYADIGQKLPTIISTYVAAHPKVNYMFFNFSNMTAGVPAALKTAGLAKQVKMVTLDTTAPESAYLKAGDLAATAGVDNSTGLWVAFDKILRTTMHLPLVTVKLPDWILTGKNVPDTTVDIFPLIANYQEPFKKAWQVG